MRALDGKACVRDVGALLSTTFGLGLAAKAPGTVTSIAAALCWWFLLAHQSMYVQAVCLLLTFAVASAVIPLVCRTYRVDDAPQITIDEVLGQWVALFCVPKNWIFALAAVVLFRLLDIWKPGPIGWVGEKIPGAQGILWDDLLAGIFVLAVIHAMLYFVAG